MQKLKNKTRLTAAVMAFTLVFLVGAAFAATDGILQFAGGIGVGDPTLHVAWDDVNTSAATPTNAVSTNVARIVDFLAIPGQPGGTVNPTFMVDHRIEWAVGFVGAGSVTLTATAENVGQLDAMVATPSAIWWQDDDSDFFDMFTVTYTITDSSYAGSPAIPVFPYRLNADETMDISVTLVWDGTFPPGGSFNLDLGSGLISPFSGSTLVNWSTDNWLGHTPPIATGQLSDYTWANNFMLSLIYEVAP